MGLLLLFLAGALQLDSGEQPIMFSFGASIKTALREKKNLQLRFSLPSNLSEMHCAKAVQSRMRIST